MRQTTNRLPRAVSISTRTSETTFSHLSELTLDEIKLSSLAGPLAREWLLAQISAAESFIRTLRQRANTFTSIHILPDDILVKIFTVLVCDKSSVVWPLSAVCRRWRHVVLTSQLFWNTVDLNDLDKAKVYLERSGTAPLSLDLCREDDDVNGFLLNQLIAGHSARTTSLNIHLPFPTMFAVLGDLTAPFPALETLHLVCAPPKGGLTRENLTTVSYTPPTPLSSSIKVLWLQRVSIQWTSPAFNNLVKLDLRDQVRDVAPSMDDFLAVLARSPNLEHLSLVFAGPMLPGENVTLYPDPPNPSNRPTLPNLKKITLHNRPVDIAHLLANLSFPSSARVHLYVDLPSSAEGDDGEGGGEAEMLMGLLPRGGTLSTLERVDTVRLRYTEMEEGVSWDETFILIEGCSSSTPAITSSSTRALEDDEDDRGETGHMSNALLAIYIKVPNGSADHAWRAELPALFRALPVLFPNSNPAPSSFDPTSPSSTSPSPSPTPSPPSPFHNTIKTLLLHWNYYNFTPRDWTLVLSHFKHVQRMEVFSNWGYYADERNVEDLLGVLTPCFVGGMGAGVDGMGDRNENPANVDVNVHGNANANVNIHPTYPNPANANTNTPPQTQTTSSSPVTTSTSTTLILPHLLHFKIAEFSMGDNFFSALTTCLRNRHGHSSGAGTLETFELGNFYWRGEGAFEMPDWRRYVRRKQKKPETF
ncbi:hypothetical protein K474DRAFT_1126632 [Panus rudis PR-1116 ss-1]|nr:hypothetical protein K474DRAFT_1126632 [Panus rudis PR-1116 ss-1]